MNKIKIFGNKKALAITAAALIVLLSMFFLRYSLLAIFWPKVYATLVTANTRKAFHQELLILEKNNPFIKDFRVLLNGSSLQTLWINIAAIYGDADRETMPLEIKLQDDRGLVAYEGKEYAFDPKKAGAEIEDLLIHNHIPYDENTFPRDLDMTNVENVEGKWRPYGEQIATLFRTASFAIDADESIQIGQKSVRCKSVAVTIKNKDVKEFLSAMLVLMEKEGLLYQDFLAGILRQAEDIEGDMVLHLLSYKNRYIAVKMELGQNRFELGCVGEKYRLDSLYYTMKRQEGDISVKVSGNHVGQEMFTSRIVWKDDDEYKIQIKWDSEKNEDNFIVSFNGLVGVTSTVAAIDGGIEILPGDIKALGTTVFKLSQLFSYKIIPSDKAPPWSQPSMTLSELSLFQ